MSQPPRYTPNHSFVSDSATLPNFPGQQLDVEFQEIKAVTDGIEANLALIQRDDGALANGTVGFDQLAPSLQTNGLAPANAWLTGAFYALGISVMTGGALYRCLIPHTSGVFATDLAAGKWLFVTGVPVPPPSPTTLGGVKSLTSASHKWIDSIGTDGTPTQTQPAFSDLTGAATIAQGGTGQTAAAAGFDALAPTTTRGDLIFRSATANARLPAGTAGYLLQTNGAGADPTWAVPPFVPFFSNRTDLKILDTTFSQGAVLREAGREGLFVWKTGDYSTQIAADTLEGIFIKATAIASTAGAWVRYEFLTRKLVNPVWFGAKLDGVADDGPATQAAINMVPHADGAEFLIPFGILRTSQKLVFSNLRATFNCLGRIMPFGAFNDFLVDFAFDTGAVVNDNVGYRPNITRLDLDCEWKSRGVHFVQPYLSLFPKIYVARSYGTALEVDGGFECLFTNTCLTLGKNRDAPWFATVAAWSSATAYNVGDHVYVKYPDWAAGTTYAIDAVVTRSGRAYRSVAAGNIGNDPATATGNLLWVSINYEYYECMIANTNKDPHAGGFTTNSSTVGNRYWKMVPAQEPLLKIDNSQASNMLIDNMHFNGLMIRDSDNKLAIWVDSNANDSRTLNINFNECQIHCMTTGLQAVLAAQYGSTILVDDSPDRRMVYFGRVDRSNFVQSYIRAGGYTDATCLQIGARDSLKNAASIGVELLELSGEGNRLVGIHPMPSIAGSTAFYMGQISNYVVGTGAVLAADPGLRLRGQVSVPQLFPEGSSARPAIAWSTDSSFGWLKNGTLMEIWQAASRIAQFGVAGGGAYASLPARISLGILTSAANDTAAAAAGVNVGELYRNGNAVQQRVT